MMKLTNKKFKTIIVFLMALMIIVPTMVSFVGCTNGEIPEDSLPEKPYDENSGINYDNQIGNIVSNGKSLYKITIPQDASPTEQNAAQELQKYIKSSTKTTLEITNNQSLPIGEKTISIGNTKIFKDSGLKVNDLNNDGFVIKTVGETLIIKGQSERSTLYGVYDFLEKQLGIRFVTKDFEHIPLTETLPLYETDIIEIPAFAQRSHFTNSIIKDLAFAAKKRMTAPGSAKGEMSQKTGGAYSEDWLLDDYHSFEQLLPFSKYKDKPGWFARTDIISQPVLSNGLNDDGTINREMEESVVLEMVKNIMQLLEQNPHATYVMLGQNDNRHVSEDDNCKRQRDIFGGHGGHIVVFVNAVAKEVKDLLAQKGIERELYFVAYAYQFSFTPPINNKGEAVSELVIPRDDVYMMLCPYEASFNSPLSDTRNNGYFSSGLRGWAAITDRFFIFDYDTNFDDYLMWYPNSEVLLPNVKLYQEVGVRGIITNGYIYTGNIYQQSLHTWLFSKLYWNPNRDVSGLILEFNKLYLGEEAGEVIDGLVSYWHIHFKNMATSADGSIKKASIWGNASPWMTDTDTLNVDFIMESQRVIQNAATLINNYDCTKEQKATYLSNLSSIEIQAQLMKYKNYDTLFYTTEKQKNIFMRDFYQDLKSNKIDRLRIRYESGIHLIFENYI